MDVEFRPGDIFFVISHDNFMSRLIAWFMRSKWSHSGIIVKAGYKNAKLIETNSTKVITDEMYEHIDDPNKSLEVWRHPYSEDKGMMAALYARDLLDKSYGYLRMLWSAMRQILLRVGITIKCNPIPGTLCDDVVEYSYMRAGVDIFKDDMRWIDTQELYLLIQRQGFIKIYSKDKQC